jgi:hypothetical protein
MRLFYYNGMSRGETALDRRRVWQHIHESLWVIECTYARAIGFGMVSSGLTHLGHCIQEIRVTVSPVIFIRDIMKA